MKEIKSILNVLESPFIDKEPLLDDYLTDQKSLISKLAYNVSTDKYTTDTEAGRDLYGKIFNKHTFEGLKSKTRQRALTTLLVSELKPEHQNTREALQHKLLKMLVQANLLLPFGARPTGAKLLNKVILTSKQYSFTELELHATHLLRSHYWFVGDKKQYDKLTLSLDRLTDLLSKEHSGENLYFTTTQAFVNSNAKRAHLSHLFKKSLRSFSVLHKSTTSYSLTINWYKLRVAHFEHEGTAHEVIKECDKVISYMQSKTYFYSQKVYVHFLLAKSGALLQLQRYDELIKLVDILRELIPLRNPNRIIVERHAFLANLRAMELREAYRIINETQKTLQICILPHVKEEWLLFKRYADVITAIKTKRRITPTPLAKISSSKDKLGTNLSALILDAVYCIVMKDYPMLATVDKKLDNYLYRYLNQAKGYKRSIALLKLLRIIIKEDYDKKAISLKARTHIQYLNSCTSLDLEPIEIITYEQLWAFVLDNLDGNK